MIAERILKLLDERGLTKSDLLKLTGLKKSTLYYLFSDINHMENIQLETLRPIATALGVSLDFIATGKEPSMEPQEAEKPYMLELFDSLSEENKRVAISAVEGIYLSQFGRVPERSELNKILKMN